MKIARVVAAASPLVLALSGIGVAAQAAVAPVPEPYDQTAPSVKPRGQHIVGGDAVVAAMHDHSATAPILLAAHRGHWRYYPENSVVGYEAVFAAGAEIVETDFKRTKDGHLVLMHDETVDRTTNGTGKVSDLTLAEIKALRLKDGLGGDGAPLTDEQVPTLEEIMPVIAKHGMINLDKGWPYREQIYDVLKKTGTLKYGLFKNENNTPLADAVEFMAKDPQINYIHKIRSVNPQDVGVFPRDPIAYEVTGMPDLAAPNADPKLWEKMRATSRVWTNTLWSSQNAGKDDENALAGGGAYDYWLSRGSSVFLTDNVDAMNYWRAGGDPAKWLTLSGHRSVRVQAEDFVGGAQNYFDTDANLCPTYIAGRPTEAVDVCEIGGNNKAGGRYVAHIQDGEWMTYQVRVDSPGTYDIRGRYSKEGADAGNVAISFDGKRYGKPVALSTTTQVRAFRLADWGSVKLGKGLHTFRVKFGGGAKDVNLDFIQLDLAKGKRGR